MNIPAPHKTLCKLGSKHQTDKNMHNRTSSLCYLDIYEPYFKRFQNKEINLLEIGVRGGNSLRVWEDFFLKASIFGVDIDPSCAQHGKGRVEVVIGDGTDANTLSKINRADIRYDIIIDDGSHINTDIIMN